MITIGSFLNWLIWSGQQDAALATLLIIREEGWMIAQMPAAVRWFTPRRNEFLGRVSPSNISECRAIRPSEIAGIFMLFVDLGMTGFLAIGRCGDVHHGAMSAITESLGR